MDIRLCTDQAIVYLNGVCSNQKGFMKILEISEAISLIRQAGKSVTLANLSRTVQDRYPLI